MDLTCEFRIVVSIVIKKIKNYGIDFNICKIAHAFRNEPHSFSSFKNFFDTKIKNLSKVNKPMPLYVPN